MSLYATPDTRDWIWFALGILALPFLIGGMVLVGVYRLITTR